MVFQGQGSDPEIVRRDRGSRPAHGGIKGSIVGRGGLGALEKRDARLVEKFDQNTKLVLATLHEGRSRLDLAQNNEGDEKSLSGFKDLDHGFLPRAEINEAIGIDQDSHFQSSGCV